MHGTLPAGLRLVPETVRERETYKYDGSLLNTARFNDSGVPIPSSELLTCADGTLTALAQLATCQTGTSRSLISLFDRTHQYITTEATPSLPLVPNISQDKHGEELWLCGTAIPRGHGVCNYTLCSPDVAESDKSNETGKLPVVVVRDLTSDPRFMDKPYCRPGSPARFYAATPIRTHRGINIGVFCVIHTEPIDDWGDRHSEVLSNLAVIAMGHLETRRLKEVQRRNHRMVTGLRCFLEDKHVQSSRQPEFTPSTSEDDSTHGEYRPDCYVGLRRDIPPPLVDEFVSEAGHDATEQELTDSASETDADELPEPETVFSRAAKVITCSIETEGCVFLDANPYTFNGALFDHPNFGDESWAASPSGSDSGREDGAVHEQSPFIVDNLGPPCRLLASARTKPPKASAPVTPISPDRIGQAFLAKLLQQYPKGHIFNFDHDGDTQRNTSSIEDLTAKYSPPSSPTTTSHTRERLGSGALPETPLRGQKLRQLEANIILEAFPGARSVAFVPIWDPTKERWSTAGFVYTYARTRIFTADSDLGYLRAFGMLASMEKLRLETILTDKAKTDALGSLSHELRSPLHGITLSLELLNDTTLTTRQEGLAHAVEICCRTLTDTIDHLLDYSKINNFLNKEQAQKRGSISRGLDSKDQSIEAGMKTLYGQAQLDVLVEEAMESVYAGFNFQRLSITHHSRKGGGAPGGAPSEAGITAMRRVESAQAMEDLAHPPSEKGVMDFGQVKVILTVQRSCNWTFYTLPGAIRRIAMNLIGNALKYTHAGIIRISLEQISEGSESTVILTVRDTGIGIGDDFLQHGLYKPFSQENQLAPGTGLGLSFVKQITAQLGGHVSMQSQVGFGTTATVTLPLSRPGADLEMAPKTPEPDGENVNPARIKDLNRSRVQVIGFDRPYCPGDNPQANSPDLDVQFLVEGICREWMQMQVMIGPKVREVVPDVVIWSESAISGPYKMDRRLNRVPSVVVCDNAYIAHEYYNGDKKARQLDVVEFISQPIGPRKLAQAVSLVLRRWEAERDKSPPVPSDGSKHLTLSLASRLHTKSPNLLTPQPTSDMSKGFFAPAKFLLVDDNNINLKVLSSYVGKLGQLYHTAVNGEEAVDACQSTAEHYRCILMDISMPIMDGFEATRQIRALEKEKQLEPALVIALTGLASESAQQEAFSSGVDLFLAKPVRLKELGAILEAKGIKTGSAT